MKNSIVLAAFVTASVMAGSAHASIEIDAFNDKLQEEYKEYTDNLNKEAGLTGAKQIKGGYVTSTFPAGVYTNGGSYGLTTYVRSSCTSGVQAVRDLVVDKAIFKKAIVAKITDVSCAYGGKGKDKFKITLTGSKLLVTVSEEVYGAEVAEKVTAFVKAKL